MKLPKFIKVYKDLFKDVDYKVTIKLEPKCCNYCKCDGPKWCGVCHWPQCKCHV